MAYLIQPDYVKYACTCGKLKPITNIYFCRHCLKVRCGFCICHEVREHSGFYISTNLINSILIIIFHHDPWRLALDMASLKYLEFGRFWLPSLKYRNNLFHYNFIGGFSVLRKLFGEHAVIGSSTKEEPLWKLF